MNRTRETPISLCERKFLLDAIKESKRLDGREVYDYRSIQITLSSSPGHVEVKLGDTRVFACVSCHVIQPRPQRPTEGQLFFNVELSPMASPSFDVGRPSSLSTEINRTLERCVKESRAVDMESLCIIAGEKVWEVRVDVHVLDHCGNIIDCAAIAALTALKHFRRPDVTVIGEDATIHPVSEREPVPLSVHHMPLCFTFAFYHDGDYLLVDPTLSEESVMEGKLVIGMNVHKEICALQMTGGVAIEQEQVMRCTQIAAVKCIEVTKTIKEALVGTEPKSEDVSSILQTKKAGETLTVAESAMESEEEVMEEEVVTGKPELTYLDRNTAELGQGGPNTWELLNTVDANWNSSDDDIADITTRELEEPLHKNGRNNTKQRKKKGHSKKATGDKKRAKEDNESSTKCVVVSSGSEEEETAVLTNIDISAVPSGDKYISLNETEQVDPSIQVDKHLSGEPKSQMKGANKKGSGKKKSKRSSLSSSSDGVVQATSMSEPKTSKRKKQKK